MKVHQLRYLATVAAEGSIRAAARALGVSQATVTQGLRELETHAEIALLTRHGHGIGFTPAGQELLAHAQRVTAQLREAEETLARHRDSGATQRLSVGVTPWVAQTLLSRVVPAFRAALPHVQLELFDGLSALTYPKLREGSLDLMVGRVAPDDAMHGLQAMPLFSYEMTVVARHGHPRSQARTLAELRDDDWILNFAPDERTRFMDNLFGQHGVEPPRHRIHLAHSASLMLTLVRQTDMLSFCPWPLVETASLRDDVVALQLRERFHANVVGIVRRAQETPSPAARCFIELFLAEVHAWVSSSDHPELRRVLRSVEVIDPAAGFDG
ncbi:LysR family transcriptional regulator [Hydrogenophaga sp.]|uniref:LysR family transcriptional regulator n=1 Tax=Hydrogenophaga sp. TaxID=1904254 RepID=UPI002731737A|nr:LysR family transcriptional regulator [Hydrogenophaga sp.]MDP2017623.1 LysR family transcriptional regulator [Hydrogenophaga sp.]MDP3164199.1 LysR family transcriptional regulator [Hydrogenophaga sp.]MDP3811384.1 LysR family transcriptional regulator [Hydrogenophaga sp.]